MTFLDLTQLFFLVGCSYTIYEASGYRNCITTSTVHKFYVSKIVSQCQLYGQQTETKDTSNNSGRSSTGSKEKYVSTNKISKFQPLRPHGQVRNGESMSKGSPSPWNTLMKKLDTKGGPKPSGLGKVENKLTAIDSTIDELKCQHYEVCAGCTVRGNFTNIPTVKKANAFFTSENIKFPIHISDHWQWRTHVKLAVQPLSRWGGLKFGLYKSGSHEVEPITDCRVHHPRINEAVEVLRRATADVGVKGYIEPSQNRASQGELRYVQLSLERSTGKVQLVIVWNVETYKDAEQSLPRLVKRLKSRPDLWHSITVNFQTSNSNSIFNYHSKAWKLLWGAPVLRERIGEAYFFFRPQIFRQANLDAFEKGIIPAVMKHIPSEYKPIVAELYSGIGVLGLNAASRSQAVFCSDSNEFVDDVFDSCVDTLKEEHRENVFYENLSADDAVDAGQCEDADVLIVDPPRRGLNEGVLKLLLDKHENTKASVLKRLIYVSCGFDALERDVRQLVESGLWKLRAAEGFVLFPGSDHLESVAVLDRVGRTWGEDQEEEDRE